MGKGGLDETIAQYAGVHQGAGTHSGVKEALETADYVLWVGNYPVCTINLEMGNVSANKR
jgi:pyruvate decarboxylase